jgi:hypothetical protein
VFDPVTIYGRFPQDNPTWVFDPVTIYGRRPHPPKYTATAIRFTGVNEYEYPPSTDFADSSYVTEINHVVDELAKDSTLHVNIEASVGITEGPAQTAWKWLNEKTGTKIPPPPLGRTKAAYAAYGYVMDARAKRVSDELITRGVSPDRIHTSRGEAQLGEQGRKVEFTFDHR